MPIQGKFSLRKYRAYLRAKARYEMLADPVRFAAFQETKLRAILVYFALGYFVLTTTAFLYILFGIARGTMHLPDSLVRIITGATLGQFAGVPLFLTRALFRARTSKGKKGK
jgi:hypothetical protein